ncbi:MAG: 16S rRNA (adenine(1518)-N(6)/adenine(1519)-N(6))-dimethyltransferase RsmA [Patescibacteria group bacterium]
MSDLLVKTREICRLFEIKPARSKGQNFLINEKIYDDVITAADLKPEDIILEVGPGLGFLTAKLAARVKQVIAVELDDKLAAYLQTGVDAQGVENVAIVNGDILSFDIARHLPPNASHYKVVANLPYNITSFFLRRFLSQDSRPDSLVLMLQKEVAERIVARPPAMSLLAASVQYYASPEIIRTVKAGNFWPEPAVDSAIIKIVSHQSQRDSQTKEEDKDFFRLVRIGFSAKRKMLKNNLAAGLKLEPSNLNDLLTRQGFDPRVRAEDLSVQDWRKLFAALRLFMV